MTTPQVDSPSLPLSTSANVILDTLPPLKESRLSKLISSLSLADRTHFLYQDYYDIEPPPPVFAIRATFLPLVNLLVSPISWIFGFVESALLLIVYCVHKLLSWMTTIFVCIIQGLIYGFIENVIKTLLATLDTLILGLMPSWMPYMLVSNLASWTGLSALRSFWYSENYLQSLKWIFIFRGAMWFGVELIKGAYQLWCVWRLAVEHQRTQQGLRPQSGRSGTVDSSLDRDRTVVSSQPSPAPLSSDNSRPRARRLNGLEARSVPSSNPFFVDSL